MNVKVEFEDGKRVYTIGIKKFMETAGYGFDEKKIKTTVKRILSKDGN